MVCISMCMAMILVSTCRLFTAVIYLVFLGLVVLLLVSVFVAQATSTYKRVHDFSDQMANYSSARMLTQTSTMLPMWFCSLFMVSIDLITDYAFCIILLLSILCTSLLCIIVTFYNICPTANRGSANLIKIYPTCGHIVSTESIPCKLFGKYSHLCKYCCNY